MMTKPHWTELTMSAAYDSTLRPTEEERIAALREWRERGCVRDWCFERVGGAWERDDDQSTWGPASVDAVDWTGFDGPAPLVVATLKGGDPNGLRGDATIWTDLEPCDGPDVWRVLVASESAAESAAENTGAELLSAEEWDGSDFGDGAIGCVSSHRPGTIVCGSPEFLSGLPEGWTTSRE